MKRLIYAVLACLLLVVLIPARAEAATASGTCGENLTWTLDENGLLTISGTGAMYNYKYNTTPWYSLREQITALSMEEGITHIGNNAFYQSYKLASALDIPNSVTSIGDCAFYGCSKLTGNLVIPDGVTSIGVCAFFGCSRLTGDLVIPEGITSISSSAFASCSGLTGNLVIPESVTTIGESAFASCSGLTGNLVIPESVTTIGEYAFSCCSGMTGDLVIPDGVTTVSSRTFEGCSGFTGSLIIPDSVITIDNNAFNSCSGLTGDLVIPGNVTTIGSYAFAECNGLKGNLVISEGVTRIGSWAFKNCRGLTGDLVIPASVTSVGEGAFAYCNGFTGDLVIHEGVTTIGRAAFYICSGLTGNLIIPDSVTSIGYGAFEYCSGLTGNLVIPEGVTSISTTTFKDCRGFTGTLVIPENVTSILYRAFAGCRGLEYLEFKGAPSLSAEVFNNCTRVKEITFNCQVPIADLACTFTHMSLLETVWVPAGTLEAYTTALSGKLPAGAVIKEMDAYIAEGTCGENLTWTLDNHGLLTISGTGAMYDYSLDNPAPWCDHRTRIKELVIENGVTTIGSYAFYGCSGLTSVVIPESVISIGEYAFGNCSNLTNVEIPDSVGNIDDTAWTGTGMGSITIGGGNYIDSFEGYEGISEIWFRGDFPGIGENAFRNVVATAYYPAGNKTWTADKLQNYGGRITWIPYGDPEDGPDAPGTSHSHNGKWFSDANNHWKECPECGVIELAPHESGSNSSGRCTVCNYPMGLPQGLAWLADRSQEPNSTMSSTGFYARIMERYGTDFSNPQN